MTAAATEAPVVENADRPHASDETVTRGLAKRAGARTVEGMRSSLVVAGIGAASLTFGAAVFWPKVAHADEEGMERAIGKRYRAIDLQAGVMTHLFPHAQFGFDGAFVIGTERFMARFGAQAYGGRAFELGAGKIGNTLVVGSLDACGAKTVLRHRVRLCVGGQGGIMAHRWIGFDKPGRRATPYVAGALKGDYTVSLTERFGLMFGVSVAVPVVGPEFRAEDEHGRLSPLVFPGPVTGILTLGASFRIG
jgi:hypothetical protein